MDGKYIILLVSAIFKLNLKSTTYAAKTIKAKTARTPILKAWDQSWGMRNHFETVKMPALICCQVIGWLTKDLLANVPETRLFLSTHRETGKTAIMPKPAQRILLLKTFALDSNKIHIQAVMTKDSPAYLVKTAKPIIRDELINKRRVGL